MPHFLIKTTDVSKNKITISDKDLYKHIIKVMRTKCGEKLLFLDENEIQYETKLSEIENSFFVKEFLGMQNTYLAVAQTKFAL